MASKLDLAKAYAHSGLYVFPCIENDKRPATQNGCKDATRNWPQIEAWWGANPGCNIGIACGPSGIFVVDCDVKPELDGKASFEGFWFEETLSAWGEGELLDTNKLDYVDTPSGGRHYYFQAKGFGNTVKRLAPGVDTRGDGGYVLAPGSVIDGKGYTQHWKTPKGFAPLPKWLVPHLKKKGEKSEKTGTVIEAERADNDLAVQKAINYLRRREPAVEGDGGDDQTFHTFLKMRDYGLTMDKAIELVDLHYNPRCVPSWDLGELEQKARNAYAYNEREPGTEAPSAELLAAVKAAANVAANAATEVNDRWANATIANPRLKNVGSVDWAVKNLIERKGLHLMSGPYGAKKTFVALHMAFHFALGKDWCGHRVSRKLRVAYVAGEGASGIGLRLEALRQHYGITDDTEIELYLIKDMPRPNDTEDMNGFFAHLRGLKVDLAIFDTWARLTTGLDENSNRDAGVVVQSLKQNLQDHGIAVFIVHHTGKETGKGARGASALPAAADLEILCDRHPEGGIVLRMSKSKNAKEWDCPKGFKAIEVDFGADADGDLIETLVLEHDPDMAVAPDASNKKGAEATMLVRLQQIAQANPNEQIYNGKGLLDAYVKWQMREGVSEDQARSAGLRMKLGDPRVTGRIMQKLQEAGYAHKDASGKQWYLVYQADKAVDKIE